MAELLDVQLLDQMGKKVELIDFLQNVCLRVTFKANIELPSLGLAYHIRDRNGFDVIYSDTGIERCHVTNLRAGEIVVMDWQFKVCLREGAYTVAVMLSIPQDLSIGKVEVCDFAPLAASLRVSRGTSFPIYAVAYWSNTVTQRRFGG
jgi:lipopolysaccharide transport system ATP-binding protein